MIRSSPTKEDGNTLLISVLLLGLLAAFSTAQFAVVRTNIRQASFYMTHSELQKYAESGIEAAVHDLRHSLSEAPGNIGTANWAPIDDLGQDGLAGTYDPGESDGIPTPGEPNVAPVAIGPAELGASLATYVISTGPGVQRVVATAANADAMVTVESYAQAITATLPRSGALYVSPTVALDLKGGAFFIDGNDHNVDGTPGPGPARHGLGTSEGANPGDNSAGLLSQIDAQHYDQIVGLGADPSVGEVQGVVFDDVYDGLRAAQTATLSAGTHTDPVLGDHASGDYPITFATGDVTLTGQGNGAGVLIVEGSLTLTGQFEFIGLILVRGDIVLKGGGAGVHVYGSVMVGESFTAVDPDSVGVTGQADILYSSEALSAVEGTMTGGYTTVYYDDK